MHPILFRLPIFGLDITIQSYGTVIVVAFLVATWWVGRRAVLDLGLSAPADAKVRPQDRIFNAGFVILFLGLFGARLVYALANYPKFTARPLSLFAIWEGGLVGYGGLVAGLLWLAWWLPKQAAVGAWLAGKGFALFDLFARGACLAFAIGWWASFLAGDDYGAATKAPWGVPLTWFEGTPTTSGILAKGWDVVTTRIHPLPVYESLFALVLFVALWIAARARPVAGRVGALFLVAHPVGHALLDLLRGDGDDRGMLVPGALSWSQFLAIPVVFTGVAIWLIRRPGHSHARP